MVIPPKLKAGAGVESSLSYDTANARLHKDSSQTKVWQNSGIRTEGKAEFSQAALEALEACWMNPHTFLPERARSFWQWKSPLFRFCHLIFFQEIAVVYKSEKEIKTFQSHMFEE